MNHFTNNENKGLLWKLLYEGGFFSNISNEKTPQVKQLFEDEFISLENINISLNEKNKLFLENIVKKISKLHNPYTNKEIRNSNNKELKDKYVKKENEFQELLHTKKPESINFELDIKPQEDVDELYKKTLESRDNDIFEPMTNKLKIDEKVEKKVTFDSIENNELNGFLENLTTKKTTLDTIDEKLNKIMKHLGI